MQYNNEINVQEGDFLDINLNGTEREDTVLTNPLELFMQEIELAVKLAPNEIWGVSEAVNIARYVYSKFVSTTQVRNEITSFITRHCQHASSFNFVVTVEPILS